MDFTACALVQPGGGGALAPTESTHVSVGAKHRLENPGRVPLTLIELQRGDYLGEIDMARFDDINDRVPSQIDSLNKVRVT